MTTFSTALVHRFSLCGRYPTYGVVTVFSWHRLLDAIEHLNNLIDQSSSVTLPILFSFERNICDLVICYIIIESVSEMTRFIQSYNYLHLKERAMKLKLWQDKRVADAIGRNWKGIIMKIADRSYSLINDKLWEISFLKQLTIDGRP